MKTEQLNDKSEKLIHWLESRIDGLEVSSEERIRIVAGCLDTALEHHKAILLLISRTFFGSAFALVRLLFEAYVRGLWLNRCASAAELELFKAEKFEKNFAVLIEEIEKIDGFKEGVLSATKLKSWKPMNSYTHSGFMQIARRNAASTIEQTIRKKKFLRR
jgi:hypothetical protein